jgi:hypothetical protein
VLLKGLARGFHALVRLPGCLSTLLEIGILASGKDHDRLSIEPGGGSELIG